MKKLRMDVDALRVEPFDVMPREAAVKGTVVGRDGMITEPWRCSIDSACYANTCGSGSCDTGNPCVACFVQK
jgi:hypothetical protein